MLPARCLRWTLGLALAGLAVLDAGAACQPLPRGVAGWWPGEDNANDLTAPGDDGVLLNGAGFGSGVVGRAFVLDGVDDRIEVPDAPVLRPTQMTVAAWVRLETAAANACIVCKQTGSGDGNSYSLWVFGGVLRGGMFRFAEAVAPTALPVNTVVHTAFTYDGAILRLFVDGKMIAAAPGPAAPVAYDTNPVIVGADDNGVGFYQGFFKGMIDEPQVFSRALSPCEIRAIARVRPVTFCQGDADGDSLPDFQDNCPADANLGQGDADGDGTGDLCDCAPASSSNYSAPGDHPLLMGLSQEVEDWCPDPSLTGPATVYDVIRGDLGWLPVASGTSVCRSRCLSPPANLVGWWPADGNGNDLVASNTGALQNGATLPAGWVRGAFGLDGVNDRVLTGNVALGNAFSVAAWVNSDLVNQGSYKRILESNFQTAFSLGADAAGTGYKFIVKSPASPFGLANGGTIVPGEWQLVVGTYDGTTGRLYVDGKQVASDAFAAPGAVNLPVSIGASIGGGVAWKGRIDEVQIYGRTLSAGEVRALYEAGSAGACKAALGGTNAEWSAPWAADAAVPAPGQGFWYLYRGRNGCGTGSYGFATGGAERLSIVCD